jgi:Glycosyl transferase family 90
LKRKRFPRWISAFFPNTAPGWGLLCLSVILFVYTIDVFGLLQIQSGFAFSRRGHISTRLSTYFGYARKSHHGDDQTPGFVGDELSKPDVDVTVTYTEPSSAHVMAAVPDAPNPASKEVRDAAAIKQALVRSFTKAASPLQKQTGEKSTVKQDSAGEVPMGRNMESLQVAGNSGPLDPDSVKAHYRKLSKAYLQTFTQGIYRHMFFDVLRRRTYALTPPGANKGMQSMMFQIIDKKVYMMDPYEVPKNSKPFYRTRINEIIWILSKLASAGRIKNTEFMVSIHDCVQTVNKPHTYRGAVFEESIPAFTIVSCNFSDNIPFPMWEGDENRGGGFASWDDKMKDYGKDRQDWSDKQSQAVFRGGNRPSMFFKNKTDANTHCNDVGRTRLSYLARENPRELDVSVGGSCGGNHQYLQRMGEKSQQKFKFVVYAEGNCFWADRLNKQVFGPSMIVKQETPCGQFWEPLLMPMTHYVPTDFFFGDLIDKIKWARENEDKAREIVRNANEFAANFLSLSGIEAYIEVLLQEYTDLLVEPVVAVESGAVEVTNKRV